MSNDWAEICEVLARMKKRAELAEGDLKVAKELLQGSLGWAWSGTEGFGIHNELAMAMKARVKEFLAQRR